MQHRPRRRVGGNESDVITPPIPVCGGAAAHASRSRQAAPPVATPTRQSAPSWWSRARRIAPAPGAWSAGTNPDLETSIKDLELTTTVIASADALAALARWVARRRNGAGPERAGGCVSFTSSPTGAARGQLSRD